ncbi:MAG: DUF6867 family protein [Phyllobacterium sp.]
MQGILYEESSVWLFLLVTCVMGGWAAWMTGRACAQTWRSYANLAVYLLVLGIGVRFIHHALFDGTMLSLRYYIADTIMLMIFGFLGYRYTRTKQMTRQYNWIYEKASPFTWRERKRV